MAHIWHEITRFINSMSMRDWFWVLAGMIVFGTLCLRGFGSRSKY
jgi:hypothetical protein